MATFTACVLPYLYMMSFWFDNPGYAAMNLFLTFTFIGQFFFLLFTTPQNLFRKEICNYIQYAMFYPVPMYNNIKAILLNK